VRDHKYHSTRRAVSGVVGAMILFAMLFTVGFGFFSFQLNNDSNFANTFFTSSGLLSNRISESLTVNTLLYNSHIGVYLNNTGGVPVNVTSLYLLDQSGSVLKCMGVGLPKSNCATGSPFPIYINVGKGSLKIDTGFTPSSGTTYAVKVVTKTGNIFAGTYPQATVSLAAQALASGAIGDLYLQFHSYTWYKVVSCNVNQWCLQKQGLGFSLPASATSSPIAFSISVTNLNSQQKNITLDQYSYLTQFVPCTTGCGNQPTFTWFIVSNITLNGQNILQPLSSIVLQYNQPTTLIFASRSAGTVSPCSGNNCPGFSSGTVTFGFIITHGCLGISQSKCGSTTDNYGQVAPYVSSLYY
jgi:hypothetical protein